MSAIYEELKDLLLHEKGTALATVVRGPEHIGAKMLVHADKSTRGTLGIDALNTLVVADAERAIWNGEAGTHTYTVESAIGALAFDVFDYCVAGRGIGEDRLESVYIVSGIDTRS